MELIITCLHSFTSRTAVRDPAVTEVNRFAT